MAMSNICDIFLTAGSLSRMLDVFPSVKEVAMVHRLMVCGLWVLVTLAAGWGHLHDAAAQTNVPAYKSASDIGTIFNTRSDPAFGDATVPLKAYLAAVKPNPVGSHHFCIVGYDDGADGKWANIHWKEGKRLILWEGAADPAYFVDTIRFSRRDLDLTKDVVATEADINSSTYLVTRAWVDRVLADCALKGEQYTIPQ